MFALPILPISMLVEIQSLRCDSNKWLNLFIKKAIENVFENKFFVKRCQVFLRIKYANEQPIKIVEIKINLENKILFACCEADSFEKATFESSKQLQEQFRKLKKTIHLIS